MRTFIALMALPVILLTASCTSKPTPPEPEPAPIDTAKVNQWLSLAAQAQQAQRWIDPYVDSAVDYYRRALALDESNSTALRGIEEIAEAQAAKARQAAERQQFNIAWLEFDRARRADPNHPNLAPTASYLELQENSTRYRVRFSQQQLQAKQRETRLSLKTLGEQAKQDDCRAVITAANDSQGRWMYQQMTKADTPGRVRAQLHTGSPSSVAVLCF